MNSGKRRLVWNLILKTLMPSISRGSESCSHGLQLTTLLSWVQLIHIQCLYPSLLLQCPFTQLFNPFLSSEVKILLTFLLHVQLMPHSLLQLILRLSCPRLSMPPHPTCLARKNPGASRQVMEGSVMLTEVVSLMMWLQSLNLRCLDHQHRR